MFENTWFVVVVVVSTGCDLHKGEKNCLSQLKREKGKFKKKIMIRFSFFVKPSQYIIFCWDHLGGHPSRCLWIPFLQ